MTNNVSASSGFTFCRRRIRLEAVIMKVLSAVIPIQPAKRDEFVAYACRTQEESKNIPGCITARWAVDVSDPDACHLFEVWESEDAYNRHVQSAQFQQGVQRYPEWLAGPPVVDMYHATPAQISHA